MVCLRVLWLPHLSCVSCLGKTGVASRGKVAGHVPAHPPVTRPWPHHHTLPGAVYSRGSFETTGLRCLCVVKVSILSLPPGCDSTDSPLG